MLGAISMTRVFKTTLSVVAAALFAGSVLLGWSWTGHGPDITQFAKVRSGMSMSEVHALLGKPSVTFSGDGGSTSWLYKRRLVLCCGIISFGVTGRVQSAFHDH